MTLPRLASSLQNGISCMPRHHYVSHQSAASHAALKTHILEELPFVNADHSELRDQMCHFREVPT